MKKQTLNEVRQLQKIAGLLKEGNLQEEDSESVQEAFQKAGIDMSRSVTTFVVEGHNSLDLFSSQTENPTRLIQELEKLRSEYGPDGVSFDYDAANAYPEEKDELKGITIKLAVMFGEDFEYVIAQK